MGTSSTAQYGARPGSGALGDAVAIGVDDGVGDGATDGVGDAVAVGGGAVGLAVADATVIVGGGVEVAEAGGGAQVNAKHAQTARRSGPAIARRVSYSSKEEDPP